MEKPKAELLSQTLHSHPYGNAAMERLLQNSGDVSGELRSMNELQMTMTLLSTLRRAGELQPRRLTLLQRMKGKSSRARKEHEEDLARHERLASALRSELQQRFPESLQGGAKLEHIVQQNEETLGRIQSIAPESLNLSPEATNQLRFITLGLLGKGHEPHMVQFANEGQTVQPRRGVRDWSKEEIADAHALLSRAREGASLIARITPKSPLSATANDLRNLAADIEDHAGDNLDAIPRNERFRSPARIGTASGS